MEAQKILKGDVLRITGSVRASGVVYWVMPGKEPVVAASIVPGGEIILGPYVNDVTYSVAMATGAPIIENIGREAGQTPIPLADFIDGGAGDSIAWGDVTDKPDVIAAGETSADARNAIDAAATGDLPAAAQLVPGGGAVGQVLKVGAEGPEWGTDEVGIPATGGISAVVSITEAAYDALDPKDPATLYVING